jgi:hypothetical protein
MIILFRAPSFAKFETSMKKVAIPKTVEAVPLAAIRQLRRKNWQDHHLNQKQRVCPLAGQLLQVSQMDQHHFGDMSVLHLGYHNSPESRHSPGRTQAMTECPRMIFKMATLYVQ